MFYSSCVIRSHLHNVNISKTLHSIFAQEVPDIYDILVLQAQ